VPPTLVHSHSINGIPLAQRLTNVLPLAVSLSSLSVSLCVSTCRLPIEHVLPLPFLTNSEAIYEHVLPLAKRPQLSGEKIHPYNHFDSLLNGRFQHPSGDIDRETEGQRDRDRESVRQTERQTEKTRERESERERDRMRTRDIDRERHRESVRDTGGGGGRK